MNVFGRAGDSIARLGKQGLTFLLSFTLLFATMPQNLFAQDQQAPPQDQQAPPPPDQQAPPPSGQAPAPAYAPQTPQQLQQLVAPIALYPDSLVAQILAASTFPEQVVEADRWVQAHPDLKGDALGKAVDQQPWDPSVKALTAFPSVLGNMDKNLSWTSSLGDAYYNQQQDVMDAVQVMRKRAEDAGNLKTTPQQTVTTQGSTVVIQPANPDVVYVPAYDPWLVYGGPDLSVAGLVCLSWNLVWRTLPVIRTWFWNRLVRRFWLGLGTLGIQLARRISHCMAVPGISRAAPRFTIGQISTGAAEPTERAVARMPAVAEPTRDAQESKPAGTRPHEAESITALARFPDRSMETSRQLEDTRNPAVRAASGRVPSAVLITEDKREASRRADSPALAAEADSTAVAEAMAVVAGGVSPNIPSSLRISNWRKPICDERS